MDREQLERQLAELPIVEYVFFDTKELVFTDRVRTVCQIECPQYGKSWACPPGVGTVEACKDRCLAYPQGLLITTMTEVDDIANLRETLDTRAGHEELTREVRELFRQQGVEPYVLSTESCAVCEKCAYPDLPCRHPERMFPCVESHGILVTDLAERYNIAFQAGGNLVTWFSLLLYQ
jgi:predicted metal-binding protein